MKKHSRHVVAIAVLSFIIIALAVANYIPGTYLMGWDNIQTDLNPWLGVKRAVWSGWQEYQSFGLPAGMAHASDAVRAAGVWLLSFVLPQSTMRYMVHFLLVLIGAIGAYINIRSHIADKFASACALAGAMVYVFNFYTVQILSLPFEGFTYFYAFLPWEIWIFLRFLKDNSVTAKTLLGFLVINILATAQSYAQQIFAVYILVLAVSAVGVIATSKAKMMLMRRALGALLLILSINAFWILPQAYFVTTNRDVVTRAKMNEVSTERVWQENKDKGTLQDFVRMENFFATWNDHSGREIFAHWNTYRSEAFMRVMSVALYGLVLIGFVVAIRHKHIHLASIYALVAVVLLSDTPIFAHINTLIREIPLVHQIFRSPFTKFAVAYAYIASIAFSLGLWGVIRLLSSHIAQKMVFGLGLIIVVLHSIPAWNGHYIAELARVKLPQAYQELIGYMQSQDANKRIALLPEYTYWGWYHHRWGYDGSGFLWYGIEQPIISRTFDVWSLESENYYWELQSALASQDPKRVQNVLEKYSVDYVLFDKSLIPVVPTDELILYDRVQAILSAMDTLTLERTFGDDILLYRHTPAVPRAAIVSTASGAPLVVQNNRGFPEDAAFARYGTYYESPIISNDDPGVYFPFCNLQSFSYDSSSHLAISKDNSIFDISTTIPGYVASMLQDFTNAPDVGDGGNMFFSKQEDIFSVRFPEVLAGVFTPKNWTYMPCDESQKIGDFQDHAGNTKMLRTSYPASTCVGMSLPDIPHDSGYILAVESRTIEGKPLRVEVADLTLKQGIMERELASNIDTHYFVLPPRSVHGLGYSVTLRDIPNKEQTNEHIITSVALYQIPYERLTSYSIPFGNVSADKENVRVSEIVPTVNKQSYYRYTVSDIPTASEMLILHQAYSPGWIGFSVQSSRFMVHGFEMYLPTLVLLPHVKVNGWSNGWKINSTEYRVQSAEKNELSIPDSAEISKGKQQSDLSTMNHAPSTMNYAPSTKVLLLFWPQYLQYAGFGIGVMTAGLIAIAYVRREVIK